MNRTERLYALVEELRARHRPVTAQRLAEHFEISVRTVQRDLLALLQAGTPIWLDTDPLHPGYVLDDTATLPPLNLTPGEAAAIAIALEAAGPAFLGGDAGAALRKV